MQPVKVKGATVIICELTFKFDETFFGSKVVNDLEGFNKQSLALIVKSYDNGLDNVKRSIFFCMINNKGECR